VPSQNKRGGSPLRVAAMVAAASATATVTASVVAMQDRQDIPVQFNQVNFYQFSQYYQLLLSNKKKFFDIHISVHIFTVFNKVLIFHNSLLF